MIMDLIKKYKEIILYIFFGGLTTLVNIVVYAVATRGFHIEVIGASVWAWFLSVVFAYITNRVWVFESKTNTLGGIVNEILGFFGCRLFSGALDIFLMWFFVDVVKAPDLMIKILSNILVIIINYIAGKFWIFKKRE